MRLIVWSKLNPLPISLYPIIGPGKFNPHLGSYILTGVQARLVW